MCPKCRKRNQGTLQGSRSRLEQKFALQKSVFSEWEGALPRLLHSGNSDPRVVSDCRFSNYDYLQSTRSFLCAYTKQPYRFATLMKKMPKNRRSSAITSILIVALIDNYLNGLGYTELLLIFRCDAHY